MTKKLGELFRQMRKDRHISLKTASDGWTSSALSRFENGQSDMRINMAVSVMERIGMHWFDISCYADTDPYNLSSKIGRYLRNAPFNPDPLTAVHAQFVEAHAMDKSPKIVLYFNLVCRIAMQGYDSTYRISEPDEQTLSDQLQNPYQWTDFDRYAIIVSARFASADLLEIMIVRALNSQREATFSERRKRDEVLTALLLTTAMRGCVEQYPQLLSKAEAMVSIPEAPTGAIDQMPLANLALAMANWKKMPTEAGSLKVTTLLKDLHQMSFGERYNVAKSYWQEIQKNRQTWRNVNLHSTNEKTIDDSANIINGAYFKQLRIRRGLSVDEVAINWDRSTQFRFENGETEFGIERIMALNAILMNDTEYVRGLYVENSSERQYRVKTNQLFEQGYDEPTLVSKAHQLAEEYNATNANLPEYQQKMALVAIYGWFNDQLIEHNLPDELIMSNSQFQNMCVDATKSINVWYPGDCGRLLRIFGLYPSKPRAEFPKKIIANSHYVTDFRWWLALVATSIQGAVEADLSDNYLELQQILKTIPFQDDMFNMTYEVKMAQIMLNTVLGVDDFESKWHELTNLANSAMALTNNSWYFKTTLEQNNRTWKNVVSKMKVTGTLKK